MTDQKYEAQENITLWWVLPNGLTNKLSPTAAELNAALNISDAVTWENYGFGQQAANLIDYRSVNQNSAARNRGLLNFGGTLGFFFPGGEDPNDLYVQTYEALATPGSYGYLGIRVDGLKTTEDAEVGDFVSVFRVASDGWGWTGAGENPVSYQITFKPMGDVAVYTVVTDGTATLVPSQAALTVGVNSKALIKVTLEGREYTRGLKYTSSNPNAVVCSKNGVIQRLATGAATITATDPNTGASTTITVS